jgi:hypothetical protein
MTVSFSRRTPPTELSIYVTNKSHFRISLVLNNVLMLHVIHFKFANVEVFTTVKIQVTVFRVVTQCSVVVG